MITDESYRKRGLATACMNFARELARRENCYKMMLLTGSREDSTLKFYERAGYNKNDKTAFYTMVMIKTREDRQINIIGENIVMMNELYRCAAVFSAKNILVHHSGQYQKAIISTKINGQILVGDFLSCEMVYGQIQASRIVQRKNFISRLQAGKVQGLAANVDIVFIVTSANRDFNLARLERYYILAKESGARICFVLSKVDLIDQYEELADIITDRFPGSVVEKTSIYKPDTERTLFHH